MAYNEQQAMVNLHVMPEEYEEQDYFLMMEVMNAKSKEDRPLSRNAFLKEIGIDPDNLTEDQQGKEV
ncbi:MULTISPECIES: hypothetical protein [Fructobacillus]|uniref:Uncharacterized protein n=1 Tax=Fructobacillus americanaquae TaxID=2940302 RepID=A0ABY5C2G1_9LACO|nr:MULTISPECIES: hypothetical protein [Fructobacillus]USS92038.1 hypothetical protein M3M36_06920 [Fructobacillus americanaquae]GIC69562.1 hypothetical protein FT12353_01990 [Fructobacillus tropaeoli]CAK1248895.1 unnamed protein product [Fructobacillus tropaeoli]